jgi:serine/threonine protein phosphatase 1
VLFRKIGKQTQELRRIIIGDVHGSFQALLRLLNRVAPDSEDEVYFLGGFNRSRTAELGSGGFCHQK